MATEGRTSWEKHFSNLDLFETDVKWNSYYYDENRTRLGIIPSFTSVTYIPTQEYKSMTPILYNNSVYYTSFENLRKPLSKYVTRYNLRPQNFFQKNRRWTLESFYSCCIDNLKNHSEFPELLKLNLEYLLNVWYNIPFVIPKYISVYEIQKQFSEVLAPFFINSESRFSFPSVANNNLVDLILLEKPKVYYSIKTDRTGTNNTIKPSSIFYLIRKNKEWKKSIMYKLLQHMINSSVVLFPFIAMNELYGSLCSEKALDEVKNKFKEKNLITTNYDFSLFDNLFRFFSCKDIPTQGQLFYLCEKEIVNFLNNYFDSIELMEYITDNNTLKFLNYDRTENNPKGEFSIIDITKSRPYWRSKNSQFRARDRIGIQI